jgi:hypothetical protein
MSKGYAVETAVAPAQAPQTVPTTGAALPDFTGWVIAGLALLAAGLGLRRAAAR